MKKIVIESSPFLFGKTVAESGFINRTQDMDHLWLNMRSSINTILISPRRWGKSSLVEHTAYVHRNNKQVKWCFIDMFSIRSEHDFYEHLSKALIKATSSKWEDWVKSTKMLFKQIVPKISMGIDPEHDFSISFDWKDVEKNKEEILNLPQKIAEKQKIQLVVCIDEFQNMHKFNDAEEFEKILRSYWQRHKKVSYCLYGSKRTLMAEIFNKKNRAFYRFGDVMMLKKIDTEHWLPFIIDSFKETKKTITQPFAQKIVQLMKNHPYYVQQLSHYVWEATVSEVSVAVLRHATGRMLEANQAFYQSETEKLSTTQINLLKAILKGVEQLTAMKTLQEYQIGTPRNVSKNITILEKNDFIEKTGKRIELIDPAFELWFRKYYTDENIDRMFEL